MKEIIEIIRAGGKPEDYFAPVAFLLIAFVVIALGVHFQ